MKKLDACVLLAVLVIGLIVARANANPWIFVIAFVVFTYAPKDIISRSLKRRV